MSNIKKDAKRGAFYWKGNKPYLSVTEILKIIDKPALRYWFGQEIYYAMLKNPTMGKEEALASPWETSANAMGRGRAVHSIVETYKGTKTEIDSIPTQFKGYAKAFYKFMNEVKPSILEHERSVLSEKYQYGGTLDLLMKIGENKPIVVDVKTGKDIYPESFLQTAAYHEALVEENQEVDGTGVLLLQEDGAYKFENKTKHKAKFEGFLAAKKLYEAIHEDMLKKVGYLM